MPVMGHCHIDRTALAELRDPGQVRPDGKAIFDTGHDGQNTVPLRRLDRIRPVRDPHRNCRYRTLHAVDLVQHGNGPGIGRILGRRRARRLRHISHKTGRAQPTTHHLWQIDPPRTILERVRPGRPGNVDMCIQRHDGSMDRKRVRLHGIVHADTLTDNRASRKTFARVGKR